MEYSLHCSLVTADGSRGEAIEAVASVGADSIKLVAKDGSESVVDLRRIADIVPTDHGIRLLANDGAETTLERLANKRDDLLRSICGSKNDLFLSDTLGGEVPRAKGIRGELRTVDPSGAPRPLQRCELRVYRDSLVVIPERSCLFQVPMSRLVSVGVERYNLVARIEGGDRVVVSRVERELEPARKAISDAIADCRRRSAAMLRDLVPSGGTANLDELARRVADGRTIRLTELEDSLPGSSAGLDSRLADAGISEQCRQLCSIGVEKMTRVGMRRRTRGDESTNEFWILVPITSSEESTMGNAIALERTFGTPEDQATLFFRIASRSSFRASGGMMDETEVDGALDVVGEALELAGYRYEPLLLTERELTLPENARHRHAISALPGLSELRHRFIGKVMHSSPEQWAETTRELLRFNVSATSDDDVFANH